MKRARKLMVLLFAVSFLVFVSVACDSASASTTTGVQETEVAVEETAKAETAEATVETAAATQVETTVAEAPVETMAVAEAEPFVWNEGDKLIYEFDDGEVYELYKEEGLLYARKKDNEPLGSYEDPSYDMKFVEKMFYNPVHNIKNPDEENEETDPFGEDGIIIGDDNPFEDEMIADDDSFEDSIDYGFGFKWDSNQELQFVYSDGRVYKLYYEDETLKLGCVENDSVVEICSFNAADTEEARIYVGQTFFNIRSLDDPSFELKS